ncbi:MAG: DUF4238 domain-containing protein [Patescibacteria group bacterium]
MSPTPQITVRQHYIPQFYMRKFTDDDKKVGVLSCKLNKLTPRKSPRSIACEDFFYGLKTGVPDDVSQAIEEFFQDLEGKLSRLLPPIEGKILTGQKIEDDEKWYIALFMSMLWIRGPAMREQNRMMSEDLTRQMMAMTFSRSEEDINAFFDSFDRDRGEITTPGQRKAVIDGFNKKKFKMNISNHLHMRMFESIDNFANLFAAKDWTIYITKTKTGFVTTDNPVAEILPPITGFYGPGFFSRDHYFSFSPEIFIHCKASLNRGEKSIRRKTLFEKDSQKIFELNILLSCRAMKFIYGSESILKTILDVVEFTKRQRYKSLTQKL